MKKFIFTIHLFIFISITGCASQKIPIPGAERYDQYRKVIEGKAVAVVANQTSMVYDSHLIDYLLQKKVNVIKIFAPEHGFRELVDAGEFVPDNTDPVSGLPVVSLYGNHRKPDAEDLKGVDIIIFDIQDVGVRFYTYISTLHYVLEACAENNIKCLVLDRPNPNGFYSDGNILDTVYASFVGMHPVPIVHGMTLGEYAMMINGEGWLKNGIKCDLTVIECTGYDHNTYYELPVRPSPNLPNQTAVYLYPSICFFEGTNISLGRGTVFPFQVYGSPFLPDNGFSFTPESVPGAKNPPLLGIRCFGVDLRDAIQKNIVPVPHLNLDWVIDAYKKYPDKEKFFIPWFDVLAGGPVLREQIQNGMSAEEIRASWRTGLAKFEEIRSKYLLYK